MSGRNLLFISSPTHVARHIQNAMNVKEDMRASVLPEFSKNRL
jgi:hypothetical protein